MYLSFLQEPMGTERRDYERVEGTYTDYYIKSKDVTVHLILLDLRYNLEHEVETLGAK